MVQLQILDSNLKTMDLNLSVTSFVYLAPEPELASAGTDTDVWTQFCRYRKDQGDTRDGIASSAPQVTQLARSWQRSQNSGPCRDVCCHDFHAYIPGTSNRRRALRRCAIVKLITIHALPRHGLHYLLYRCHIYRPDAFS